MHPVSLDRGRSWFPATITTGTPSGSALVSRVNWWNAWRIAGFVGRTVWNTSPATTTRSGRSAITRSMARVNVSATSASRWLMPSGRHPLVLAVAEVQIGEVNEAQAIRGRGLRAARRTAIA